MNQRHRAWDRRPEVGTALMTYGRGRVTRSALRIERTPAEGPCVKTSVHSPCSADE